MIDQRVRRLGYVQIIGSTGKDAQVIVERGNTQIWMPLEVGALAGDQVWVEFHHGRVAVVAVVQ